MLALNVREQEFYDENNNMFINVPAQTLQLEHSLVSISKWESKHQKAFLKKVPEKTQEEMLDYIRCMTLNTVDPMTYIGLTQAQHNQINEYINDRMSATYIYSVEESSSEVITSELIYYWMIALQIPFECQHWHLNRLFALIQVCNVKNKPKDKQRMSYSDICKRNDAINAARRKKYHSKG